MGLLNIFPRRAKREAAAAPADRLAGIERQCQDILQHVKGLHGELAELSRREAQLRAVLTRDAELDGHHARLQDVIGKGTISTHVARSIRRAELKEHPFPHAVVDDVLPDDCTDP